MMWALPFLLLAAVGASTAHATVSDKKTVLHMPSVVTDEDLPQMSGNADWMSASPGMQYQLNDFADEDEETARKLREIRERVLFQWGSGDKKEEYSTQFINGDETYYSDYSQAWRMLGMYIDCNSPYQEQGECYGDGDGGDEAPCMRYLMWAAYVDIGYQGGGIGEYQFFNRHSGEWMKESCSSSGRCEPFDCHLPETNFKLLAIFKEPNFHTWMEQLFKHEGVCVWTDEEYEFMQQDREAWPCKCAMTSTKDENGNYLYYDLKPMEEGRISLGLYTDAKCSVDYAGGLDTATVIANAGNDDRRLKTSPSALITEIATWNDAFDVYKTCQPCIAYDLQAEDFECEDAAGYNSVNQCMKFKTKTDMITANVHDVALATNQGTIVTIDVLGTTYGQGGADKKGRFTSKFSFDAGEEDFSPVSIVLLGASLLLVSVAFFLYSRARKEEQQTSSMSQPLVNNEGVLA